jgi:NAD(P)-dependent dehydrogenase (short-subunit alcohol dehydrogenase family)
VRVVVAGRDGVHQKGGTCVLVRVVVAGRDGVHQKGGTCVLVRVVVAGRDGVHQKGGTCVLVRVVVAGRDGVHQKGGRGGAGTLGRMPPTPAEPRTVLTTGANSGIGLATAIEIARRGYRSIGSVRTEAKAEAVREAADAAGVEVETVLLDVTDADACGEVVPGLDLHCLVNNAGYAVTGAIEDIGDDEARRVLETMVIAPMRLARLALPAMRERGDGRIVNISSIAGLVSSPLAGWYTGSKHALEALSDSLRIEVARDGIKVVLVEPGGFRTGIWEEFERDIERFEAAGSRNAAAYERMLGLQRAFERVMGEPEGCARVVADAVSSGSPRGRYLVGVDAQLLHASSRFTPPFVRDRVLRLVLGM